MISALVAKRKSNSAEIEYNQLQREYDRLVATALEEHVKKSIELTLCKISALVSFYSEQTTVRFCGIEFIRAGVPDHYWKAIEKTIDWHSFYAESEAAVHATVFNSLREAHYTVNETHRHISW